MRQWTAFAKLPVKILFLAVSAGPANFPILWVVFLDLPFLLIQVFSIHATTMIW